VPRIDANHRNGGVMFDRGEVSGTLTGAASIASWRSPRRLRPRPEGIVRLLMIAFGWIVWESAPNRSSRVVGALLVTQAVFGIFWPPMHQRAALAAGGATWTGTLHIVWTIVTSVFFMGALGFGAAGLGKRFRFYSLATMAIVFACGAWSGTYAPAIQSNLATPLERARRLIPSFEGELVPGCRHDMCASQHEIVDVRVLEFLDTTRADDPAQATERSFA
jgi:hypothetical protein